MNLEEVPLASGICQYGTDLLTTGQRLQRSPTGVQQIHLIKIQRYEFQPQTHVEV